MLVMAGSLAAGGMAYAATPRKKLADMLPKVDLEAMFPKEFGEWTIDRFTPVVQPSPEVQAKLNVLYNQILARTYLNAEGQRVMLSVAYGGDQSDGLQMHLPEVCYPAQGFQVSNLEWTHVRLTESLAPIKRMRAELGRRIEQVSYWTTLGDRIVQGSGAKKLAQISFAIRGVIPDGFLVRISTLDPRMTEARRQHDSFASQLILRMTEANRSRVAGTPLSLSS
jgi:EpsI family protein